MRHGLAVVLLCTAAATLGSCAARHAKHEWESIAIPTDADFAGVWFADSLNGWITGGGWAVEGGLVGRTRDGGRTWRFQSGIVAGAGSGFGLGHVVFRDSLHGLAVGERGGVWLTDDGGGIWRPARYRAYPGAALFDVQFIDASTGWAAGPGALVRTEDGGETWRLLMKSTSENGYWSANAIHFLDASHGWLVGHAGAMRSDDGGENWRPVDLPVRPGERPNLRDLTFADARHGWIVGELGSIFHTEDGGAHWARQERGVPVVRAVPRSEARPREPIPELETPPDRLALFAVRFADANRGWAVGNYADVAESVVLGTVDGGATWGVEHVQRGEMLHSLFVLDARHAWAAGDRARTAPQVVLRYAPGAR